MSVCPDSVTDLGLVRDVLGAVDCNVQAYALAGYQALSGPTSPLPAAMTVMLTIYVAVIGYRLLFAIGGPKLSDAPLIAVEIGAVLALTLNWGAFQTVVFNFSANAPLELARVISRPMTAAQSDMAADPLSNLQAAYGELSADGEEFGKKAGPNTLASRGEDAASADALWTAATALLASTVGVLSVATIATGVLTAVGPVFIALFLFEATRGFFAGWLRALVATMLAPMACWITTALMLIVVSPWVEALAQQRQDHQLKADTAASTAMIVLVFAVAQAILVLAGLLVAGGFQLGRREDRAEAAPAAGARSQTSVEVLEIQSRTEALTRSLRRAAIVDGREAVQFAAPGASGGQSLEDGGAYVASERPARLGETYRRGAAIRDRGRLGMAGRI